jgi:FkbM family methyltransferase
MVMESPYRDLWRELDEVEIMRRFVRAGDVVFDIGANIGLHSIVLSRFAGSSGRLHAFEPNAELLPALTHTIGQLGNASLHAVALSNKNAESSLFVPPDDSVASLADWTALSPKFKEDGPAHLVDCRERRLSDLIGSDELPQPDFMKCDVEGAELQVFQGACETLDRVNAPVILFEANECASRAFNLEVSAAKDFLSALVKPRYRFFEITAGGKLADLLEIKSSFLNILAVPRSKLRYWPELAELGSQRTLTRHSVSSAKI